MGKLQRFEYEFTTPSVFNIEELNSSFALGSLKVLYLGENRNHSDFSKEVVEKAIPSIYNVPIVCNYNYDENTIGSHDVEVVKTKDGGVGLRNLTQPVGVVPESASYRFEIASDSNGDEHEYLVLDNVLLWKRQDAYSHIVNDLEGSVGHSMEVSINDAVLDKATGVYEIKDFEFNALCLLEKGIPCFQGSELELYSEQEESALKEQIKQMMSELKETLYEVNFNTNGINNKENHSEKGGTCTLDKKNELLAEYGIDADSLDFSIDDLTIDELRAKFEEMKKSEDPSKEETFEEKDENPEVFELSSNLKDTLRKAVKEVEEVVRPWGEREPKYWMVDFDEDKKLVYVESREDWCLYAMDYSMDGDNVVIDKSTLKKMKWAIVDFEEGSEDADPISAMFSENETKISELIESNNNFSASIDEYTHSIEEANSELEVLRKFKLDVEEKEAISQRNSVFEKFEELNGIEAFEDLKNKNCLEYSLEDLEEKCFAIKGKFAAPSKFEFESKQPKIKVDHKDLGAEEAPYGGVVEYYSAH